MANRFLTLNVGVSQAVLAEYSVNGKHDLTLLAYGMAPLAPVDADSPGSMEAVLTPALHQIMREKGIKPGPTVVSLNAQSVFPRFAKVPSVGEGDKLRQMVGYEVEQNVPFPMDEIVWNFQILGNTDDGDRAVMIVAAKLDHVRGVISAVRGAGLTPLTVDVAPMAVYNVLRYSARGLSGCSVVLDMGSRATSLIISENEKVYIRSIPVGGNTITKEIAQTFGCSMDEAEQLKREQGYVALGGVTEDADEVRDRVSKVIRGVMTRLHAEIARSINFYRSQQGGSPPEKLFLTGGTALIPQTDEFFRDSLQVEVEYLNPFASVTLGAGVETSQLEAEALTMNESVGLALRRTDLAFMQFDLMPPEIIEQKRAAKRLPVVVAGELLVLAALGAAILAVDRDRDVAVAQNDAVIAQRNNLQKLDNQIKSAQKDFAAEEQRADAVRRLLASRPATVQRLDALRRSLLPGMWVREWQTVQDRRDADESVVKVNVTIRGWRDELDAEVRKDAQDHGKTRTAPEIVQENLKTRSQVVRSVKISKQVDVKQKGCLDEFTLEIVFTNPGAEGESGKKGGRQ